MAKAGWGIAAALGAGILLIREAKASGPEAVEYLDNLVDDSIKRTREAAEGAANVVAGSGAYWGKKARDAVREEAAREAVATAIPVVERQQAEQAAASAANYGTVTGALGAYTGLWRTVTTGTGDRCSVMFPSVHGKATRFFTGAYCRSARAAGLII